jgi:hypothetical protein
MLKNSYIPARLFCVVLYILQGLWGLWGVGRRGMCFRCRHSRVMIWPWRDGKLHRLEWMEGEWLQWRIWFYPPRELFANRMLLSLRLWKLRTPLRFPVFVRYNRILVVRYDHFRSSTTDQYSSYKEKEHAHTHTHTDTLACK